MLFSVPETPNITNAYSWLDTSRRKPVAVLSIEWMVSWNWCYCGCTLMWHRFLFNCWRCW